MIGYLDASALVPLFIEDVLSNRIDELLRGSDRIYSVSDLAIAEFSSAIALRVRRQDIVEADAPKIYAAFDAWTARAVQRVETSSADILAASALVRRLDLSLRAPDAIHIATVQRTQSALITFDAAMAAAARSRGVTVKD